MLKFFSLGFLLVFALVGKGFSQGTTAGSVTLYNDAPFPLTADVLAADGSFLGQVTLQPGEQRNFTQNLYPTELSIPGSTAASITPYSVIWKCTTKGVYSMCTNVSPGSYTAANNCPGLRFCPPKETKKPEEEQQSE